MSTQRWFCNALHIMMILCRWILFRWNFLTISFQFANPAPASAQTKILLALFAFLVDCLPLLARPRCSVCVFHSMTHASISHIDLTLRTNAQLKTWAERPSQLSTSACACSATVPWDFRSHMQFEPKTVQHFKIESHTTYIHFNMSLLNDNPDTAFVWKGWFTRFVL